MKRVIIALSLLSLIVLLSPSLQIAQAQVTLPAPVERQGSKPTLEVDVAYTDHYSPEDVSSYWTPQMLQSARPYDLRTFEGAPNRGVANQLRAAPDDVGPVRLSPSGAPGETPRVFEMTTEEALVRLGGNVTPQAGGGTPPSIPPVLNPPFEYTRYRLFPDIRRVRKTFPYRAVGKLFFTIPYVGIFVCSGSVVSAVNRSVVWTAGHCVVTPAGTFPGQAEPLQHTNFLFIPAFHRNHLSGHMDNPFGAWTAHASVTLNLWSVAGLSEYDYAALVMARGGKRGRALIAKKTGFLGFLTNFPRFQHWHVSGYPAGPQSPPSPGPIFDGGHQEICTALLGALDQPSGIPGVDPPTNGIGCDQTGGASGGPWLLDFSGSPGFNNLVNSNNSYRYVCITPECLDQFPFLPLELYGPYFGAGAALVKQFAETIHVPRR